MIIGINGKINSGKDTIGKIIQYLTVSDYENVKHILKERNGRNVSIEEHFKSFIIMNYKTQWQIKKFADKLKDIVCILLNCTREQLEDRDFKEKELGEEWRKWYLDWLGDNMSLKEFGYFSSEVEVITKANQIGITEEDIKNCPNCIKSEILTPRLLLQLLCTDCGRDIIHPNIWVNALFSRYNTKGFNYTGAVGKEIQGEWEYPNWIITDLRFPNELKAVKDRDGITIRVNRINIKTIKNGDSTIKYIPMPNIDYKEHESETALDGSTFDYEIDNNGTIEELIEKVKQILIKEEIIN